jgi:IS1 family transposase
VKSKKRGKLTIQCDEMWSFVGNKGNKQWIWLAIDVLTKEIVGVYIGQRDKDGDRGVWNSLPQYIVNVLSVIQTFGVLME